MSDVIQGLKLIQHNHAGINDPDDPSYPWRLEVHLSNPEFMEFAHMLIHPNGEVIVVRGTTLQALEEFSKLNHLEGHARLLSFEITGPETEEKS